jgi:hypothetical protein
MLSKKILLLGVDNTTILPSRSAVGTGKIFLSLVATELISHMCLLTLFLYRDEIKFLFIFQLFASFIFKVI